jgi:hypothetical protein
MHRVTLFTRPGRDGLEFLCQNATHRFDMKPHCKRTRREILAAGLLALCLSAPVNAPAQELEIRQPDSAEFIGAAGVELPQADSFEELEARRRARQTALEEQSAPARASGRASQTSVAAPIPSERPKSSRKRNAATPKPTRHKSVALAPLPKTKPNIIPIEEVLQPNAGEDETPLVEVVDSFSPPTQREFDDSARR